MPQMTAATTEGPPGQEDQMRNTAGAPRRDRWWRLGIRRPRRTPRADAASSQTTADAVQLAIGLLTASLDSAELQAWAIRALPTEDPAALGDLLAGLHIVSQLLLQQLHEATGQPPAATLQALAIVAETSRDRPSGG
jgi:hypothetical protein